MKLTSPRDRGSQSEDGNAIVEFIFVAILVLIPLVYLIVAVATVQRGRLAVTSAARDVGRALASAEPGVDVEARQRAALNLAFQSQGLESSDVRLSFVSASASCDGPELAMPDLTRGAEFAVCVRRTEQLPGVPSVLDGKGITQVGRYLVHMDEFRRAE